MVELLVALSLAPWSHPLAFRALPGWQTGASGTTRSAYVGSGKHVSVPQESTAWIAKNVRYRDPATADPPNTTLAHLPRNGVIVWAVIFAPAHSGEKLLRLDLGKATFFVCCEGAYVAGGAYELTGNGPGIGYSAIVRIFFGSHPTRGLRAEAQRALDQLALPTLR
jgi:hypothetical protein